mmetsp:Transcript_98084/g.238658  ORF Transcript_98084/g.238658 Transcript_98084/m.238658 type:complete len:331 (+) Transcript_98084:423-1415(+)
MVHPVLVLLQEAGVRVGLQVLVAVNHQHPGGRREVPRVARDVPGLVIRLPGGRSDRQPEVQERELLRPRLSPNQQVVRGDVAVVGDPPERCEDGRQLRHERGSCRGRRGEVAGGEAAAGERPVQELNRPQPLGTILVHAVEPAVQRPAGEPGHGQQHLVLAGRLGGAHAVRDVGWHALGRPQLSSECGGELLEDLGFEQAGLHHPLIRSGGPFECQGCLPLVLHFPHYAKGSSPKLTHQFKGMVANSQGLSRSWTRRLRVRQRLPRSTRSDLGAGRPLRRRRGGLGPPHLQQHRRVRLRHQRRPECHRLVDGLRRPGPGAAQRHHRAADL